MNKLGLVKIFLHTNKSKCIAYLAISILTIICTYQISNQLSRLFAHETVRIHIGSAELIIVVMLYLLLFVLNNISNLLEKTIQRTGEKNFLLKLVSAILYTDYSYFVENNPKEMATTATTTANKMGGYYLCFLAGLFGIIKSVVYLNVIYHISAWAFLVSILVIPFLLILTITIGKKISLCYEMLMVNVRKLSAAVIDGLIHIDIIKSKNAYLFYDELIRKKYDAMNASLKKHTLLSQYMNGFNALVNSITPLLILYLMMKYTELIHINIGQIIVLYTFIPLMLLSVTSIYNLIVEYYSTRPFIHEAKSILSLSNENKSTTMITEFESLEVNELSVTFSGGNIVKFPNCTIFKGDKVLLIGESGSGKSTFFNILTGLCKIHTGSVLVNGNDVRDINIDSLRSIFGISFQSADIFSMSLIDNITLGSGEDKNLNSILRTVELDKQSDLWGEDELRGGTISGGEKARVSIARVLHKEPDVLLLDESLSSVDEDMEQKIINSIIEMHPQMTIICISHRESLRRFFDKVITVSPHIGHFKKETKIVFAPANLRK